MKKVQRISGDTCTELRGSLVGALAYLKNKNLDVDIKGMRYGTKTISVRIEFNLIENGKVFDREAQNFRLYAPSYKLELNWLGKTFTTNSGKLFKLTGINPGARKYPVNATMIATGQSYKFTPESIIRAFNKIK